MSILDLNNHDSFKVIRVSFGSEVGKRLADMGFTKGANGIVIRSALFGDPIQVNIRNYNISIRKAEAAKVEIEVDNTI